jgi:hypothetical protein
MIEGLRDWRTTHGLKETMSEVDFGNIEPPDRTGLTDSETNRLAGRLNDQEGGQKISVEDRS